MNVLVIGKPNYDVVLPVDSYPSLGAFKATSERLEQPGGISVYVACMLSKWGIKVHYAGLISGDETGNKIKAELEKYNVDIKNVETNFEVKSNINYITLDKSNGLSSSVLSDNGAYLTRFKYDIIPDYIIVDGSDIGGGIAAANNYPTSKIIFIGNKVNEQYYDMSKRSHYVCANFDFAKALTKLDAYINKPKTLVNMFQKIKDLNKAQYILMLKENGVLYVKERQVKMIPAVNVVKKDDSNYDAAFFGAYAYSIIRGFDMDMTAKVCNMAAFIGTGRVGSLSSIPDKEYVFNTCGLTEPKTETPIEELTTDNDMPQLASKEGTTNAQG